MQDLRAFEMLADLESNNFVTALIDEDFETGITFSDYPSQPEYLLELRKKVNAAIMERLSR